MIRKFEKNDIDRVAELWLETNICAHDFISEMYWKDNFDMVKELFVQAEIYVYEDAHDIQGFVGLDGNYIAGIFVSEKMQSGGIGQAITGLCKKYKEESEPEGLPEKYKGGEVLSARKISDPE